MTDVDFYTKFITTLIENSFPVAVAVFLLLRMEKRLAEMTEAMLKLTNRLEKIKIEE